MIKNRKLAQVLLVTASVILISIFVVIVLEKNNLTKLFTNQEVTQQSTDTRPVNSVSYSPASTTEQQEGDALKQELINNSNKPASSANITVSFSAATQDNPGGPVIVKALINGTTTGTCNLVMSKGEVEKTYNASVTNLGTYYGCDGFSVPVSDISTGSWKAVLTVSNGSSSGSVEQQIEVGA
jgi:cytoskeletal protein RodZ